MIDLSQLHNYRHPPPNNNAAGNFNAVSTRLALSFGGDHETHHHHHLQHHYQQQQQNQNSVFSVLAEDFGPHIKRQRDELDSFLQAHVSVGTLLAFTTVAISVLVLGYVPPSEVPLPSSLQESIDSVSLKYGSGPKAIDGKTCVYTTTLPLLGQNAAVDYPTILKQKAQDFINEKNRREVAGWTITLSCIGIFFLTYAASDVGLSSFLSFALCGFGGALLLFGLVVLTCIDQDDARHDFGHSGGFICSFVPLLHIACILINVYLLINLGTETCACVSVWLAFGVIIYIFYGRTHSSLLDAVYVPAAHAGEIYRSSKDTKPNQCHA